MVLTVVGWAERLRTYFCSKNFLIGQRMERFLYTEGVLDGKAYISFDFNNTHTFWGLTCLLLASVIFDFLTLMVAGIGKQKLDSMERRAVLATALDLVLVCGCLAAFLVAEKERCCHVAHESSTANDSSATESGAAVEEERRPTCFVVVCCCWRFLTRWGKNNQPV